MDRYGDLYRASASAGGFHGGSPYYYDTDRRSAYALPAVDALYSTSFGRVPLDAHAGYGAPDLLLPQRYSSFREQFPTRRPWPAKPTAASSLGPRKKPFKKTKNSAPPPSQQQKSSSQKITVGKPTSEGKPSAATLAEETRELHRLFRTGVEGANGKKSKNSPANDVIGGTVSGRVDKAGGRKRKVAAVQKKDQEPSSAKKKQKGKAAAKKSQEEPSGAKKEASSAKKKKKKQKKGNNTKPTKGESLVPEASATKQPSPTVKPHLTGEEVKAVLELQTAACNAVREFLGIPEAKEVYVPEASKDREKIEDAEATQTDANPVEGLKSIPPPSPGDEKVLQEQGYKFFTKLFQDNQDLRKMYLDRKDAGPFECLVCSSTSSESSKKFTNLTSLVMHTSMRKKNQPEHLGYGQAVCDVLGWEPLKKKPAKQQAKDNGGELATSQPEKLDENAESVPKRKEVENIETANPLEEKTEEGIAETSEEEMREAAEAPEEEEAVEENGNNEGAE